MDTDDNILGLGLLDYGIKQYIGQDIVSTSLVR